MAGTRLPRSLGLSAGAASRSSAPSLGPSGRSARARAASPAGPESPCRPFLPREARPALPRARHRPPRGVSLQLAASPPRPGRGRPAGCGLDGLERRGACPQPRAGVRFSGRGARLRPRGGGRRGGQNGLRPGCRFHRTPGPRTCGLPGHSSLLGARPDCPTGRGSSADSLGPPPRERMASSRSPCGDTGPPLTPQMVGDPRPRPPLPLWSLWRGQGQEHWAHAARPPLK